MVFPTGLLTTIDPSLGRIDKSSLPQQTRMELLVDKLDDNQAFRNADGSYRDVSLWPGVTCADDSVTQIKWYYCTYQPNGHPVQRNGSIDVHWIPETVTFFNIANLYLFGSVNTGDLPRRLHVLRIDDNRMSGTFSIRNLPLYLTWVDLTHNQFSGRLRLTRLPPSLRCFRASKNMFSGKINLTALPVTLTHLSLSTNTFEGSVNLEHLPNALVHIELQRNLFQQEEIRLPSSRLGTSKLWIGKDSCRKLVDENGRNRQYTMLHDKREVQF